LIESFGDNGTTFEIVDDDDDDIGGDWDLFNKYHLI